MTDQSDNQDFIHAQGIYSVPILHYTLECAQIVRRTIRDLKPDVIAVEYPKSLEAPIKKAVGRLPYLTALTYQTKDKITYTIPIEPADPLVEAVRCGMERDIPLAYVDADVDQYPAHRDYHPDPYAIFKIGLSRYYKISYQATPPRPTSPQDRIRENGMAYHLQQLKKEHKIILFICGMSHLGPVLKRLDTEQAAPLQTVKRKAHLFNIHPESSREIMGVYPFLSVLYEQWRGSNILSKIRRKPGEIKHGNLTVHRGGGDRITPDDRIVNLIIDAASELDLTNMNAIDRWNVQRKLFEVACGEYQTNTCQEVVRWQEANFFRFGRNYALVEGRLLPDFFQSVQAAKSCVDENFCYDFWNVGSFYPWQEEASRLPTIRITPEMLMLGDKKLRIRPHFGMRRSRPVPVSFRKRLKEKHPGEWGEKFHDSGAICSYRKEDFILEGYGQFLKKKGTSILQEEHSHTEPFTTSIYDGVDLKTTLRHWYERKIFVKLNRNIRGAVGSVVLIFDTEDERYPYCVTWLGEDEQESDQAFYATSRDAQLVGPGITRHEYGGFLLSYPPRRLYDVWRDPNYRLIRSKAQRLLVAGIEYALERYVVYVAPEPPCPRIKSYASHLGRTIIYIPISQLSPTMVKKIRVFHVLANHATRETAQDFIW